MSEWPEAGTIWHQKGPQDNSPTASKAEHHVLTAYYNEVAHAMVKSPKVLGRQDYLTAHDAHADDTLPLRLCIESEILIKELQRICKAQLHQKSLVLIPPYKLLIHHWDAIQATLQTLKEARGLKEDAELDSHEAGDIDTRIEHLECLHDFVQTDLAHLIGLRLKAKEATLEYVSFEEVYYLFSPGDLVVGSNTGEDQLYQVYAVTGGRMRLKRPERFYDTNDRMTTSNEGLSARVGSFTNVRLACYILAWDGSRIGPIHFPHEIQPFPGKRRITELTVYPLRFLKDSSQIQTALQIRGRNVVECSGHRRHSAQSCQPLWPIEVFLLGTLSRSHENTFMPWDEVSKHVASEEVVQDVDGDVYIDYRSRYRFTFEMNPLISSLPRPVVDYREIIESINGQTDRDFSHGDHDVDDYLTDQFLLTNQHVTGVRAISDNLDEDDTRLQLLSPYVPGYEFRSRCWSKSSLSSPNDAPSEKHSILCLYAETKVYSVVRRPKGPGNRLRK